MKAGAVDPGMRTTVLLAGAALLLAGCAAPAPGIEAASSLPPASTFTTVDSGAGCAYFCEPNAIVLASGEWFVLGDALTRSLDEGATFEPIDIPPSPLGPASYQTDAMIEASPDGSLYYSALIAACPLTCVALVLSGIQVARSEDLGETWSSTYLTLPSHFGAPGADRQWLSFGADGLVCLNFQYVGQLTPLGWQSVTDPEIRASCSDDGGATFPDFVSVSGPVPNGAINGRAAFDSAGRMYVPYFRLDSDGALVVATSDDAGRTFEEVPVEDAAGDYFPSLAIDGNDTLHLLWRNGDGAVSYATSVDRAATWSAPILLGAADEETPISPWIEARGDVVRAVWFVSESDETNALVAWDGERTSVLATGVSDGEYRHAGSDFAHVALTPDGRAVAVFGDIDSGKARLAVGSFA